jgi:hypothetical protein
MTLAPGTRLGPYAITAPLGAGGAVSPGRMSPGGSDKGEEGA